MAERGSYERSSTEIPTSPVVPTAFSTDASPGGSGDREITKDDSSAIYDSVVRSEIGVNTLLARLKQSIASARDFGAFLKKRSALEEEHAQALKKLCRSTAESVRRPDNRQGSFARSYTEISGIHDRIADNGVQFALSLHQMHEDLQELATDKERRRKEWKQRGLSAEKRFQDAEAAMDKAKAKYNTLAEDYDRARTGDKQSGRFGLKGPKSAAQVEEDLQRKMQAADADHASKVQNAQALQEELVNTLRPQAIQALEQLIHECDSGLSLQMQKFATFNEKLLLSNGLCVSPVVGQSSSGRSLRDVIHEIDNEKDLKAYVSGFASRVAPRPVGARYEPPAPSNAHIQQQTQHPSAEESQSNRELTQTNTLSEPVALSQGQYHSSGSQPQIPSENISSFPPSHNTASVVPMDQYREQQTQYQISKNLPPVHPSQMLYDSNGDHQPQLSSSYKQSPSSLQFPSSSVQNSNVTYDDYSATNMAPNQPVFGVSLDELFLRDGSAVPMVVYQCLQAIDLFGLDVEGIYRLSGNATHIAKLRSIFDHDSSIVDFRNPEDFFHDVNSVAGLLKQFFRDLPDPLLTREHYQSFIEAARVDEDVERRDRLHGEINKLPDPNYATFRALTLHLHRVQEHSIHNKMKSSNLAISFGPTLMVGGGVPAIADAGWQVRAIDTILQNAYSIFDED